jgi:hypothetical protein
LSKNNTADPSRRRAAVDGAFADRFWKLRIRLIAFRQSRRATAAIEFALILPLALLLYVGAAEIADSVITSRKVNDLARTLADLLSRQPTSFQTVSKPAPPQAVSQSTLRMIFTSAQTLLYPEPTSSLKMTLSAIDISNDISGHCCVSTIRWSFTQAGALRTCGVLKGTDQPIPLPDQIINSSLPVGAPLERPISYLVADVSYVYQPLIGQSLFAWAPPMLRTIYMMPRSTGQVIAGPLETEGSQTGQICY